jgi:hypothetical protein
MLLNCRCVVHMSARTQYPESDVVFLSPFKAHAVTKPPVMSQLLLSAFYLFD